MIDLLKRKDGSDEGSDQSQENSDNSNSDYFSAENSDNENKNQTSNKEVEERKIFEKREEGDEDVVEEPKYNQSYQIQPKKILKRKEIIYEPKVKSIEPPAYNQSEQKIQGEEEKESNYIRKYDKRPNAFNQNIEYVVKVKPKPEIEEEPYPKNDQYNKNLNDFSNKNNQEVYDDYSQDTSKLSSNKNNIVYVKKEKTKETTFEYVPKQQNPGRPFRQKPQASYSKKKTGKSWRDMNSSANVPAYVPKSNNIEMQKMNSADFKLNSEAKNFIPKNPLQQAESSGNPQYYNNSFNFPIQNPIFYHQYPILIPSIIPPPPVPIETKIPESRPVLNVNSQEYIPSSKKEKDKDLIPEKKEQEDDSNLHLNKKEKSEGPNEIKLNVNCKEYQPPKKSKGKETNNYLNQQFVSVQLGIPPINLHQSATSQIASYAGQPVIYPPYYYST